MNSIAYVFDKIMFFHMTIELKMVKLLKHNAMLIVSAYKQLVTVVPTLETTNNEFTLIILLRYLL